MKTIKEILSLQRSNCLARKEGVSESEITRVRQACLYKQIKNALKQGEKGGKFE